MSMQRSAHLGGRSIPAVCIQTSFGTFDCASFGCKLYSEHLIIYFQTTANKKKIKLHKTSKDRTSRMQCTFCETMTVLVRLFLENNLYINSVLKK